MLVVMLDGSRGSRRFQIVMVVILDGSSWSYKLDTLVVRDGSR